MTFPRPADDETRVTFLHDLSIMDTSRTQTLDRITYMCKQIFQVEIVAITLLEEDRQWFKSFQGINVCETERGVAFCNYTILSSELFEVTDATSHPDLKSNPLVVGDPGIRYYAGVPLNYDGYNLGSLCLLDLNPREPLTSTQRDILANFGELVVHELKVTRLLRQSLAMIAGGR